MNDQDRLRAEYARRAQDPRYHEWYADTNAANRLLEQERDGVIQELVRFHPALFAPDARVLDIGCGAGHELAKWRASVAEKNLCGIDLLPTRVTHGRRVYPTLPLVCGDASNLPFASHTFQLVTQFTVFTSILDADLKQQLAREMLRVLKPHGAILWYDYWFNPTNPQTRGIPLREIRKLFPECSLRVRRVTLAPPLARWVVPRSYALYRLLHRITWLRSHYLIVLERNHRKFQFDAAES